MRPKHTNGPSNAAMVPFMSLASLLIPMLLMGAQFITLGVIDSALPAVCGHDCSGEPEREPLNLAVAITDEGLTVTGSDPSLSEPVVLGCLEGQCDSADAYDTAALTALLGGLKDAHPDEESVIVVPESRVPYEALIRVFDATRTDGERELFPYPTVAGGAG